jgi:alpha-beta hydrolase superfamily lysophospholipase
MQIRYFLPRALFGATEFTDEKPSADIPHMRIGIFPVENPLGTVPLILGRSEAIEKYAHDAIALLNQKGLKVIVIENRGQGGSSRFTEVLKKNYIPDFGPLAQDISDLFRSKFFRDETVGPLVVVAHSQGAHILERALVDDPSLKDRMQGLILNAAMMGIYTPLPGLFSLAAKVANYKVRRGAGAKYMISKKLFPDMRFISVYDCRITRSATRLWDWQNTLLEKGHLFQHGTTWGWFAAASNSMAYVNRRIASMIRPRDCYPKFTKFIVAEDDIVICNKAIHARGRKLGIERIIVPGCAHETLFDTNESVECVLNCIAKTFKACDVILRDIDRSSRPFVTHMPRVIPLAQSAVA